MAKCVGIRTRGALAGPARRTLCWGTMLFGAQSACVTTTVTRVDVERSVVDTRLPVHPEAPSISADFSLDGNVLSGRVRTARCTATRTWQTVPVTTTETKGNPATAWGLTIAGSALSVAGIAAREDPKPPVCTPVYSSGSQASVQADARCESSKPDNTATWVLLGAGVIAATAGLITLLKPTRTQTVEAPPVAHRQDTPTACVRPDELDRLKIAIAVSQNRLLRIPLAFDGTARVALPSSIALPSGATVPIVVLEGPPLATTWLRPGQVIGTLRVPAVASFETEPTGQ